jgi:hypothetical protein
LGLAGTVKVRQIQAHFKFWSFYLLFIVDSVDFLIYMNVFFLASFAYIYHLQSGAFYSTSSRFHFRKNSKSLTRSYTLWTKKYKKHKFGTFTDCPSPVVILFRSPQERQMPQNRSYKTDAISKLPEIMSKLIKTSIRSSG